MPDGGRIAVHAGYPLRDRMNEIRAGLPDKGLLSWDRREQTWVADLGAIARVNPAAHQELAALTTPEALAAKNAANAAWRAEQGENQEQKAAAAAAPAPGGDRMRIFPDRDTYEALKAEFSERGLDGVIKWDFRRDTKGPYIDLNHPKVGEVDLAKLAPLTTDEVKVAFEKRMEEARKLKNAEAEEPKAAVRGTRTDHLERGDGKRVDLYPTREQNKELRELVKAAGAGDALRWDNRAGSKGFYLDMGHPDAGKLDLDAFAAYRTPEAKAAFEKGLDAASDRRAQENEQVRAAGETAVRERANRREIPENQRDYAEKPLWMPHKNDEARYRATLAEVKSMETPTLIRKFLVTEKFINERRADEAMLKGEGKTLSADSRMQLLAAMQGKEVLRGVLVEDRGISKFAAKGKKQGGPGEQKPARDQAPAPAPKPAAEAPKPAAPAQAPAPAVKPTPADEAAAAMHMSEAAKLARGFGRG